MLFQRTRCAVMSSTGCGICRTSRRRASGGRPTMCQLSVSGLPIGRISALLAGCVTEQDARAAGLALWRARGMLHAVSPQSASSGSARSPQPILRLHIAPVAPQALQEYTKACHFQLGLSAAPPATSRSLRHPCSSAIAPGSRQFTTGSQAASRGRAPRGPQPRPPSPAAPLCKAAHTRSFKRRLCRRCECREHPRAPHTRPQSPAGA